MVLNTSPVMDSDNPGESVTRPAAALSPRGAGSAEAGCNSAPP